MIPFVDLRVTATLCATLCATLLSSSCVQDGIGCSIDAPCQGATLCHVATGRCIPINREPDAHVLADGNTSSPERTVSPLPDRGFASRSESSIAPETGIDGAQEDGNQKDGAPSFIPCFDDSECPTGYCVRHVCCDIPCQIPCVSCIVPGHVGICTPVPCHSTP